VGFRLGTEGNLGVADTTLPVDVAERLGQVAGLDIAWLEAPPDSPAPVLYLHGVPTASWDWMPFLERTGGVAPDLPGFGRSAKPATFDYSIDGYDRFLERLTDALGPRQLSLVMHDWGAVGLAFAQRLPERIERLVLLNCVPFLPGYRWHRIARIWRTPLVGELSMGLSSRFAFKQISRESNVAPGPMPDEFVDAVWRHFDHGTQRAILRLYRSASEESLRDAGRELGKLRCPALVLWSEADPYIGAAFGGAYAEALGRHTTLEVLPGAGHWSWLDRPEVVERVATFLAGGG
jgi:pimeloyl-ACP methyl ester carboxylesterase